MIEESIDILRVVNAVLGGLNLGLMFLLSRQWWVHRSPYQLLGVVLGLMAVRDIYGTLEILLLPQHVPGGARVWLTTGVLSLLMAAMLWYIWCYGIVPPRKRPPQMKEIDHG